MIVNYQPENCPTFFHHIHEQNPKSAMERQTPITRLYTYKYMMGCSRTSG